MRRPRSDRAFTLLEVVLAIGLTAVVLYLISTAIELFLYRVDSSRTQVESAQLARTLLDSIAADLAAVRYEPPASMSSGPSGSTSSSSVNASDDSPPGDFPPASGGVSAGQKLLAGLFGNEAELRVDRRAAESFNLVTAERDPGQRTLALADLPHSVRYYFEGDERQSTAEHAGAGVGRESSRQRAGLYRHRAETSTILRLADSSEQPWKSVETIPELLAPEVVSVEFAYFDGKQFVATWDSAESRALPAGVEICLRMLSEPERIDQTERRYDERNQYDDRYVVEYRRFVQLPLLRASYEAPMLQTGGAKSSDAPTGTPGSGGTAGSGEEGGGNDGS
ncbi:type II secretion system protein [Pirellulales bacterium]|nr:type II secretion system protein [Pirellulales bacterium]